MSGNAIITCFSRQRKGSVECGSPEKQASELAQKIQVCPTNFVKATIIVA